MLERAAERVAALPFGRVRSWDAEPRNRSLNAVRVDGPPPDDLVEHVHEAQADLPMRFVELDGADIPPPPGWAGDVIAHLCFEAGPPEPDPRVRELDRPALRPLRRQWLLEELPHAVDLITAGDERVFSATPTRGFAVVEDGRPVSMALLMDTGPLQMVEDVYTAPSHRGHGLGAAVVRTAVRAALDAGAEIVHLPTARGGPAERLYRRLGFAARAHTSRWVLDPAPGLSR